MTVTGENIRMDVKRMSHEACQIKCQNILYIFIDYTMRLCQTTCQSIYQTTSETKCLCQTTCQSDFQETCWICQNMCQTTCHTWCQRICQNNLWNICPNVWNVWRYFIIHVRMDIRIYIYIHTLYFGGDHTKYSILFFSQYRTGFWFPADILRFSGKGKAELAASN